MSRRGGCKAEMTSILHGWLEGIVILDLADDRTDFCSRILADMGARVIKIERPGGSPSRRQGPYLDDTSSSTSSLSFLYNNVNKLSVTLNLEHPEARPIFLKLLQKADVLVESSPPGHLKRLNLDYDSLSRTYPRLIIASLTGFGPSGPRMAFKACDLTASAYGGQMYVSGSPEKPPLKAFGSQPHFAAALNGAMGIMLALRNRNRTEKGDHLDISLQASVTSTLEHVMVHYLSQGLVGRRQGSLHRNGEFAVLPCKDGFIHMSLFQQWETLIEWMDAEGMAEDLTNEDWRNDDYRRRNVLHVIEVLKKWTTEHTVREIFELAQLMRFPWAPVQSPSEVLDCPQLTARDFFLKTRDPESGRTLKYPGVPYRASGEFDPPNMPAPLPGQHNQIIYNQELAISAEELEHLQAVNAI